MLTVISTFVLGSEVIGPRWRSLYVIGSSAAFAGGIVLLAGVAAAASDWRHFAGLVAVAQLPVFLAFL